VDAQRDPRLPGQTHAQTYIPRNREEAADDLSRRERLQRVLARLNRLHEPQASASDNAYGNRTPSPNRQSLYDWAPGAEEGAEDTGLDAILSELRRQQPETSPELLRLLGQSQMEANRDSPARAASYMRVNGTVETYEQMSERRRRERQQSLRNRALLQRARQESSPSATERMLRYVMERERSGMSEEEERARGSGWFRPTPRIGNTLDDDDGTRDDWLAPPRLEDAQDRDRRDRVDAFRRGYLAEHAQVRLPRLVAPSIPAAAPSSNASLFLENALKYLSDLRSSQSVSLSYLLYTLSIVLTHDSMKTPWLLRSTITSPPKNSLQINTTTLSWIWTMWTHQRLHPGCSQVPYLKATSMLQAPV
jgi:hypothetical protein